MITGSTPTVVWSTIRARGLRPSASAFFRSMSSTAAAPSEIWDELPAVTLPSSLNAGLSWDSASRLGVGADALVGDVGVAVDLEGDGLALEAALLGGLMGELVRADADLVELRAGDLPLVGDHLGGDPLRHEVVLGHQLVGPGGADLVDPLEAHAHRDVAHVLDAGADGGVVHAGGDQRRREVHRLLGRAALAVDRGGRGLDRQAGLEPGVAADVEHLLAVLLHAAGHDVLDLGGRDAGALDHLGVALAEELVRMRVLVVALLGVAPADRRPDRLDDDYLASALHRHVIEPPGGALWR